MLETTPISELLRYSPHQRYGHRIKITGAVTLAATDHLYVQGSTGGVEIRANAGTIRVGDIVEAVGYPTLVGRYSPVLTDAVLKPVGRSGEIAPHLATVDSILESHNDSALVAVEGRIRMAMYDAVRTTLVIQSGVHSFTASLDNGYGGKDLRNLHEGSVLRLIGVCSMQVDSNRLYTLIEQDPSSFELLLRSKDDVVVVRQAPFNANCYARSTL